MQSITNEDKIARGTRLGKIGVFVSLGFLGAGLLMSLTLQESPYFWISLGFLLLGLLASSVGTTNMNRWVREPRADQALAHGLAGFDDRYRLYNYTLPAPHVLLSPKGLFVITALGQDGVIRYDGTKFRRDFSLGRLFRFMADEGLGRPLSRADSEVEKLRGFLDAHEVGKETEIQSILVFYNPRAELLISSAPCPVIDPKGLNKAVRTQEGEDLSRKQYRRLWELFDGALD
ncbi:MAG: nuclease-related domain-containing protein [Anaerolineae bacterium]|jgi:hypothetical protein